MELAMLLMVALAMILSSFMEILKKKKVSLLICLKALVTLPMLRVIFIIMLNVSLDRSLMIF